MPAETCGPLCGVGDPNYLQLADPRRQAGQLTRLSLAFGRVGAYAGKKEIMEHVAPAGSMYQVTFLNV